MVKPSVCTTIPKYSNQLFLPLTGSGNRSSYLIAQRRKAKNRAKLYYFYDICKFFIKKSIFSCFFRKKALNLQHEYEKVVYSLSIRIANPHRLSAG